MKKNMKLVVIGILIGVIITSGIVYVIADTLINASQVSYSDTKTVADAIGELLKNSGSCPNGFTCSGNEYNVTFVSDEEDAILFTTSKIVIYGSKYGTLDKGYKKDRVIEGWYLESDFKTKVTEDTYVTIDADHTLYAKWIDGETNVLYGIIANGVDANKTSTNFDWSKIAGSSSSTSGTEYDSNGKGIYEYDGGDDVDGGSSPIYFYRGNVNNNNVIFAGYCWKIIRTTSTGGVKMIYSGEPSSGKCNNTGNATFAKTPTNITGTKEFYIYRDKWYYVGYVNGGSDVRHGVSSSSLIKEYIEGDWFINSHFNESNATYGTEYAANYALLEDTPFCIDRRGASSETATILQDSPTGSTIYYGAYNRDKRNISPSLSCYYNTNKDTDKLTVAGGQLNKKIGLISADEIRLAGGKYGSYNYTYYLYNGYSYSWSLSPYYWYDSIATLFFSSVNGFMGYTAPSGAEGVRPVVSLSSNAEVSGGNGEPDTPYIVNP